MKKTIKSLLVVFFSMCFSFAFAQETTSEIQGIVTTSNKGIENATIVATHMPTGTKYSTTSRKGGSYNLPNLRIGGPYEVTVTYIGHKSETESNVTLLLGQSHKSNFDLKISADN